MQFKLQQTVAQSKLTKLISSLEGTPVFLVALAIAKGFRVQGFHLGFQVNAHPERLQAEIRYITQRLQSGAFRLLIAEKHSPLIKS